MNDLRESGGGLRPVITDFLRDRKDRIDKHSHRKLVQVTVVENAAPRSHLKAALLLHSRTLDELAVTEDLQPDKPSGNHDSPECEEDEDVEHAHTVHGRDDAGF